MTGDGRRLMVSVLVPLDVLSIAVAMVGACAMRQSPAVAGGASLFQAWLQIGLFAIPVWLAIYALMHLYSYDHLFGGLEEYTKIIKANSVGTVAIVLLSFFEHDAILPRSWVALTWLLSIVMAISLRFLFRRAVYRVRRHGKLRSRVVMVGANERSRSIAHQLNSDANTGSVVIGFLDDQLPVGFRVLETAPVLGSTSDLVSVIEEPSWRVNEVLIVPEALSWESFRETVHRSSAAPRNIHVRICPGLFEILTSGVWLTRKASISFLTLNASRLPAAKAVARTMLDYPAALVLTVLCGPLMAAIALWLRFSGRQTVIDHYEVAGLGGRRFRAYKFHTGLSGMGRRGFHSSRSELYNREWSATRVQRWLYLSGLDKLPQLFNILRGEMSLVGPRALNVNNYPNRALTGELLTMRPGITGPWAFAADLDFDEETRITAYYIRNWSIWLDLQILARTAACILHPRIGIALQPRSVDSLNVLKATLSHYAEAARQ